MSDVSDARRLVEYYSASYPPSLWAPPAPLRITSPQPGADVPPVHDVIGTGPIGVTVELWFRELPDGQDTAAGGGGVTDQIGPLGSFLFVGDTPATLGEIEWFVKQLPDGPESPRVPVTVVESLEGEPEPEEYDPGAHTVAEVEAYIAEHPDERDAILQAEAAGKNRSSLVGSGP